MESKRSIIALLGILMSIAALAAAQPTPFLIGGWVNCTDGNPVNDPSVTVTNQYTSEVFIAETNASSNYYQIITSSDNVSAGNVLHFVVNKGSNSTEFDHVITTSEVGAGGFEWNATIGHAQPTPFLIGGWVNCTDGNPVNDPSVTVTNQYTSEVFIAETNASSNYYQIITSSDNVSAGNVLHFVVNKGSNSTEFDHSITTAEVGAGGFEWNATIGPAPDFVCGDCDQYAGVTTNDGWLIYMNLTFPGDSRYAFTNAQAADCDIYSGVTTNDGWLIYMNLTFPGNSDYVLRCD